MVQSSSSYFPVTVTGPLNTSQNPLIQIQNYLKDTIATYHSTQIKNHYLTLHHLAEIHHPHQTQCLKQHRLPMITDQTALSEKSSNSKEKGRKLKHSFRTAKSTFN